MSKKKVHPYLSALPRKRQLFVLAYVQHFNGARAAREAGYSEKTAASIAHEMLRHPDVKKAVEEQFELRRMPAEEAINILEDIARGDIGDFINIDANGLASIDLAKAKGKSLSLIKKIKQEEFFAKGTRRVEGVRTEVELYDRKSAAIDILKLYGKFRQRVEQTSFTVQIDWDSVTDEQLDELEKGRDYREVLEPNQYKTI